MNQQKRREIFERLRADNPQPTTELNYSSPFELLIAVLLSAQATDVGVNKATAKLFAAANTPQAMLEPDPMTKRDVLELVRAYEQISTPQLKKQLLEMAKAMAKAGE